MAWNNLTFVECSILTSSKMTLLQENFSALADQDSGAPLVAFPNSALNAAAGLYSTGVGSMALVNAESGFVGPQVSSFGWVHAASGYLAPQVSSLGTAHAGSGFIAPQVSSFGTIHVSSGMEGNLGDVGRYTPPMHIQGLVIANNGTDADHDIDIATGEARDSTDADTLALATALTKQIDASWAVGDDAGGLDAIQIDGAETVTFVDNGGSDDYVTVDSGTWSTTPSIGDTLIVVGGGNAGTYQITAATSTQIDVATGSFTGDVNSTSAIHHVKKDTWLHVWIIKRSDTGVVDVLFSESATAPTMPANYDLKRRIGSVLTDGSANIIAFTAYERSGGGLEFRWITLIRDYTGGCTTNGLTLRTLTVPIGLQVLALFVVEVSGGSFHYFLFTGPDESNSVPSSSLYDLITASSAQVDTQEISRRTNTSAQIRDRGSANYNITITTRGWIDDRT